MIPIELPATNVIILLLLSLGVLLIASGIAVLRIHRAQQAGLANFMYTLTHDGLSNPIQSAQAATDNLERELTRPPLSESGPDNNRAVVALDDLNHSLGRLSSTAANLRHLALLEVDKNAVLNERINLVLVAQELVLELGAAAETAAVRLLYEGKSQAIAVLQQPDFIRNILDNLLRNAIKYTTGQADACVVLSVVEQSAKAIVVISDNGVGINDAQLASLTRQPQKPIASTVGKAGSGLGLYLVKRLLTQCGGTMDINSEIDKGTVITIEIPAVAAID